MASPAMKEMQLYSARLVTFHAAHQPNKRRKSSTTTRKKKDDAIEWPHKTPSPDQLARAGFFYRPVQDSHDNVQCFFCSVKLDGWEPTDDPVREHLSHSDWCAWATARSVERDEDRADVPEEERDPMSETMMTARQATFTFGDGWPHEGKTGWRCKVAKMVEAGWAWDPTTAEDEFDGVTCFYCNLSVDGWEPKDDPLLEHRRRMPDCTFFKLLERYHGNIEPKNKTKKQKSKRKGGASSSTAGRASIQSNASELPTAVESFVDSLAEASLAGVDDSVVTTSTMALQTTTTGNERPKKRGTKSKASSKAGASKKKAASDSILDEEATIEYPDLGQDQEEPELDLVDPQGVTEEPTKKSAPKSKRKPARQSKQAESSVAAQEQTHVAPKKPGRTRKVKAQEQPQSGEQSEIKALIVEDAPKVTARSSNASAQLQEELENSMDNFDEVLPADQSTPPVAQTKIKRGVKRTSDGVKKAPSPPTVVVIDDSLVSQGKAAAKPKKQSKPKPPHAVSPTENEDSSSNGQHTLDNRTEHGTQKPIQLDTDLSREIESLPKAVSKKTKARPKAKQTSTAGFRRSSQSPHMAVGSAIFIDKPENPERDEMEIEEELKRIEAEQVSKSILVDSPVPDENLKQILNERGADERIAPGPANLPFSPVQQPRQSLLSGLTPSPSGSDKENRPSSIPRPSTARGHPQIILSPTKTTKIPLAPGTPNRSPGRGHFSPSKHISHLSSNAPWTATDLDVVLLQSPQPTPGKLGQAFAAAVGELSSPEKKMSVEEWVNYRAMTGEEEMKRRCEEMVAAFEREGIRGLQSLAGINVIG